MSFHCYWLARKAEAVWVGWASGKPSRGKYYEYPCVVTDLATLPPTSLVYVDGVKVRR